MSKGNALSKPSKPKPKESTKRTKLAIVGFSPKSRDLAPFDDPEWEIWGCNHVYRYAPRVDALFEIHKIRELEAKYGENNNWPEYAEHLRTTDATVWMQDESPDFPKVKRLPIEDLKRDFGYMLEHYEIDGNDVDKRTVKGRSRSKIAQFKSTLSYMLAMAIRENRFTEIAVYGVDMSIDSEWHFQRNNFCFYMGWCKGLGIELVLPDNSALLQEAGFRLYGYEESKADKYKELISYLGDDVKKADAETVRMDIHNENMAARIQEMVGAKKVLSRLVKEEQFNGHREFLQAELDELNEMEAMLRRDQSKHLGLMYETVGARKKAFALMEQLGYHNRGEMPEGRA